MRKQHKPPVSVNEVSAPAHSFQLIRSLSTISLSLAHCLPRQTAIRTTSVSAMRLRAALITALLVLVATTTATWAAKSKGDCTDATFANAYSSIRKKMDMCEVASGQAMQVP